MTTAQAHRRHEQAELREQWLAQNPPPPIRAPRAEFEKWHRRWLASPEHAVCLQIEQNWLLPSISAHGATPDPENAMAGH